MWVCVHNFFKIIYILVIKCILLLYSDYIILSIKLTRISEHTAIPSIHITISKFSFQKLKNGKNSKVEYKICYKKYKILNMLKIVDNLILICQLILGSSTLRYAGLIDLSCLDGDGFKLYILLNYAFKSLSRTFFGSSYLF